MRMKYQKTSYWFQSLYKQDNYPLLLLLTFHKLMKTYKNLIVAKQIRHHDRINKATEVASRNQSGGRHLTRLSVWPRLRKRSGQNLALKPKLLLQFILFYHINIFMSIDF